MRILVVNVNTTESITQTIAEQARSVASPGTEIVGLTPYFGAESVEGNFESYLAAIAVMDRVMAYDQPFDAVIQAGYGEHGPRRPTGIVECAGSGHHRSGSHHRDVPRPRLLGGDHPGPHRTADRGPPETRRPVSTLRLGAGQRHGGAGAGRDPLAAMEAIVRQAELAIREDKAEVICLGCGGMAGLDERFASAPECRWWTG